MPDSDTVGFIVFRRRTSDRFLGMYQPHTLRSNSAFPKHERETSKKLDSIESVAVEGRSTYERLLGVSFVYLYEVDAFTLQKDQRLRAAAVLHSQDF